MGDDLVQPTEQDGATHGISPMITSMKSTHKSVSFKHSAIRLYMYVAT